MQRWTLRKIKKALKDISGRGWIKTKRKGDTGIGKTLESLLGIRENNIPLPDIGLAEIKSYRRGVGTRITFFTKEPYPYGSIRDRYLLDNFGYSNRPNNRRKELKCFVSSKVFNNQGLRTKLLSNKLKIVGREKMEMDIFWKLDELESKFNEKFPALIFVLADRKLVKGIEYFKYNEAYLLREFDENRFKKLLKKDDIIVDLRMHYKPSGAVRNHGTGFRILPDKLDDCFDERIKIL